MTFSELGINDNILQALQENKISEPTDIQLQAIPHILEQNTDLVAVAQTGTGKTAAFCLPILQTIDPKSAHIQALVLVPTRELGQQVAREFFLFSKYMPRVFAEAVYGGAPIEDQIKRLKRSTHVVVYSGTFARPAGTQSTGSATPEIPGTRRSRRNDEYGF